MSIYTRRGDTGKTRIYGNREFYSKTHPRIQTLGTVDELNSQLGVVFVHCATGSGPQQPSEEIARVVRQLNLIQQTLFELGAQIATAPDAKPPFVINKHKITQLETWINWYERKLPPLANFIFPGGGLVASHLHIARTVCRRAERTIVEWNLTEPVNPYILAYLNRLSDYLLVLARWANKLEGKEDRVWHPDSKNSK